MLQDRTRLMTGRLAFLAGLAVLLAACGGGSETGQSVNNTAWTLTELDGAEVEGPAPATLVFGTGDQGTAGTGEAFGSTGCNSFNGPYTTEGDSISIGPLITTLAGCIDPVAGAQEGKYLITLETAETFSVAGEELTLTGASGETGATFMRFEPDLTLSSWEAVSINNGTGGVQSVVAGSVVTVEFGEIGQLAGSGGCNTYATAYRVGEEYDVATGGTIQVASIAARKTECEPAIVEQEENYFTALESSATWIIRGLNLELRDDGGAVQVLYVRSPGG